MIQPRMTPISDTICIAAAIHSLDDFQCDMCMRFKHIHTEEDVTSSGRMNHGLQETDSANMILTENPTFSRLVVILR